MDLERLLHTNSTRVVEIVLPLSKREPTQRLLARTGEPDKNWKISPADIEERKFWTHYREAYEDCLSATSTADSPWYVVPAVDKENARLIVSQIVVDTLEGLGMSYPKVTVERAQELQSIRVGLERGTRNMSSLRTLSRPSVKPKHEHEGAERCSWEGTQGATDLPSFIKLLGKPRAVWLMVSAGAVDAAPDLNDFAERVSDSGMEFGVQSTSAFRNVKASMKGAHRCGG